MIGSNLQSSNFSLRSSLQYSSTRFGSKLKFLKFEQKMKILSSLSLKLIKIINIFEFKFQLEVREFGINLKFYVFK